jgi:hypothetical protein
LTADITITVPQRTKFYLFDDQTTANGYTITLTTGAGGGENVTTLNGATAVFFSDGTNMIQVSAAGSTNAATLGGVPAADYAQLVQQYSDPPTDSDPIQQTWIGGQAQAFVVLEDEATTTINCQVGNKFYWTLGGDRNLDIENPADGQSIELWIIQNATGGFTVSFPGNCYFEGGTPTLASAAGDGNQILLTYSETLNIWIGMANTNFSSGEETGFVITGSMVDTNLYELLGAPDGTTLSVAINNGVVLRSTSPANGALDMSGFSSDQTITLTNNGFIIGCGGDGGNGAECGFVGSTFTQLHAGGNGFPGGPGISNLAAATCTLVIYNATGYIWGGGGGGGGGGATAGATNSFANGGGGGGGQGGGHPGRGGCAGDGSNHYNAGDGAQPISLAYATYFNSPAAGGAGNGHGTQSNGAGGDGGGYGLSGDDGTNASESGGYDPLPNGTGGAGGYAIAVNGMTVSIQTGSSSPHILGTVG